MAHKEVIIDTFLDTDNWVAFSANDMSAIEQSSCPCCDTRMEDIVHLKSRSGTSSIRIGCCSNCGYVGYIDKPSEDWVAHFYNDTWDNVTSSKKEKPLDTWNRSFILDYINELKVPKESTILDVGCGYGPVLWQLEKEGYSKLFGVEHSRHRAEFAQKHTRAEVTHTPFFEKHLATFKKMSGTFRIIYSKSVLEHVYNPNDFFSTCQALQENGDYLMLMVPDAEQEPALTKIFFVPHLHSFSARSLAMLAERHGYTPRVIRTLGAGLHMIAEKSTEGPSKNFTQFLGPKQQQQLIAEELCIDQMKDGKRYVQWSHKRDRTIHGIIPSTNSSLNVLLSSILTPVFNILPLFLSRILYRLFYGIPRKRKMLQIHIAPTNRGGDFGPLNISQDEFLLYYK